MIQAAVVDWWEAEAGPWVTKGEKVGIWIWEAAGAVEGERSG
jgi:hypothetical protein